ncbi:hypothetical protein KOAAANKH_01920 [Brevundimonas sp. NIBR10]|uniref:hypothetical protein n=1 Tax=Brevundimonas sp. NIBR10 TaxID=3015997 RepID=UPI0022F17BA6|nr:hypothetical protein [Brevundimonas sp. NIBR10]WGM47046.1 hypothetical protein KOAAANKH_01920 [Brevundimonas sp. NIBR10]
MIALTLASVLALTPQSTADRADYMTALMCGGVFRHAGEVVVRYGGGSAQPSNEAADLWRDLAYIFGPPVGYDRAATDTSLANQLRQQRMAWDVPLANPDSRRATLDYMNSEQKGCTDSLRDMAARRGFTLQ